MRPHTSHALALGVALAFTGRSALADDTPAPDPKVLAVREAAHVPTLMMMKRSLELSALGDERKAKALAVVEPLVVEQRRLVADAQEHPDHADADRTAVTGKFADGMKTLQGALAAQDGPKLMAAEKLAAREGLIFDGNWPVGTQPDPLPGLVKAVGLDEKQQAAVRDIRAKTAAAKDKLLDEQTAVGMTNQSTDADAKYFVEAQRGLGTAAAEEFRATLTGDQRAKWDSQVRSMAGPAKR